MSAGKHTRLVHEGRFVAEVEVELLYEDNDWSPLLSLEDADKLDTVRRALKRGDTAEAAKYGRVYSLMPIAV